MSTLAFFTLLISVLQLLVLVYFIFEFGRLRTLENHLSQAVVLLTVLANKAGATTADVKAAVSPTSNPPG